MCIDIDGFIWVWCILYSMAPQCHNDSGSALRERLEQLQTDTPTFTCAMCDTEVDRHTSFCSDRCQHDADRYTPEPEPEPRYDDRMDPRRDHPSSWNNLR